MKYVNFINDMLRDRVSRTKGLVCYGQNIAAGSCLSGLTRGLEPAAGGLVLNSPNAETTLVGMGFGVAIRGGSAIYFMKQLDFLLLGMDHLVNTWNIVRGIHAEGGPMGSFTIFVIVVDSGFEGPQSCLNNLGDFCSISHLPGYAVTNAQDATHVLDLHLTAPGCRIVAISQRLFGTDILARDLPAEAVGDALRYVAGDACTIASFNFSFPQAHELHADLVLRGHRASLFSVPAMLPASWDAILADAKRTGHLVVVDDGKSENRASDRLLLEACRRGIRTTELRRRFSPALLAPNDDVFRIDSESINKIMMES